MTSLLSRTIRRVGSSFAVGRERLATFLFFPASDQWLTILRVGLGVQIILCAFWSRGDWGSLFTKGGGVISRDVMEAVISLDAPLAPIYFAAVFLIHPDLGFIATTSGIVLIGIALLNQKATALWDGFVYDDWTFLFDAVALAGSLCPGPQTSESTVEKRRSSRFLPPRLTTPPLRDLFFRGNYEVPRERMVDRREYLARADTATI